MNEATRIAQRILDEQGYIVMANVDGIDCPIVGKAFDKHLYTPEGNVLGPFFVIAEESREAFMRQEMKYFPDCGLPPFGSRFFRVVAE